MSRERRALEDRLLDLLYEEVDGAEAAELQAQLEAHPETAQRLQEWRALREAVADLPELEPDPQVRYEVLRAARKAVEPEGEKGGFFAWLEGLTFLPALAGVGVAVLAASTLFFVTQQFEDEPVPLGGSQTASAPEAPAAATVTAAPKKSAPAPVEGGETAAFAEEEAEAPEAEDNEDRGEEGKATAVKEGLGRVAPAAAPGAGPAPTGSAAVDLLLDGDAPNEAPALDEAPLGGALNAKQKADARPEPAKARPKPSPRPAKKSKSKRAPSKKASLKVFDDPFEDDAKKGEVRGEAERTRQARRGDLNDARDKDGRGAAPAQAEADDRFAPPPPAVQPAPDPTVAEPEPEPEPETEPAREAATAADVSNDGAEVGGLVDDAPQAAAPVEEKVERPQRRSRNAYAPPKTPDDAAGAGAAEQRPADTGEAVALLDKARAARRGGNHRVAVRVYEKYIAEHAGHTAFGSALFETAQSYEQLGDRARALQLYRLVVSNGGPDAERARQRVDALSAQVKSNTDSKKTPPAKPKAAPAEKMESPALE